METETYLSRGFTAPGKSIPKESLLILCVIWNHGKLQGKKRRSKIPWNFQHWLNKIEILCKYAAHIIAFFLKGNQIWLFNIWLMKAFPVRKIEFSWNFTDLKKTFYVASFTILLFNLLKEPFSLTLHGKKDKVSSENATTWTLCLILMFTWSINSGLLSPQFFFLYASCTSSQELQQCSSDCIKTKIKIATTMCMFQCEKTISTYQGCNNQREYS